MFRIIAILCFLTCTASFVTAAPIVLRLGHIAEPENPYAQGAMRLAQLVENRSHGEMAINIFPSGKLGTQRDLIEEVSKGSVDLALTSSAVLASFVPQIVLFDLPFLFRDKQHAYKALDTIGIELSKNGQARGIITLAFWENGMRQMTNNVRPIIKPEDMKGLKFRVMEQPICIEMMKAIGARPVPMSITELYDALKDGLVDGQENPLGHIVTKHYYKVQKYISLTSHTYTPEPLLISAQTWMRLTPDQQNILRTAAEEIRDWQRQLCSEQEKQFLAVIRENGTCEINENVDLTAFRQATRSVWELYTRKFGDETLKAVLSIQ